MTLAFSHIQLVSCIHKILISLLIIIPINYADLTVGEPLFAELIQILYSLAHFFVRTHSLRCGNSRLFDTTSRQQCNVTFLDNDLVTLSYFSKHLSFNIMCSSVRDVVKFNLWLVIYDKVICCLLHPYHNSHLLSWS